MGKSCFGKPCRTYIFRGDTSEIVSKPSPLMQPLCWSDQWLKDRAHHSLFYIACAI